MPEGMDFSKLMSDPSIMAAMQNPKMMQVMTLYLPRACEPCAAFVWVWESGRVRARERVREGVCERERVSEGV